MGNTFLKIEGVSKKYGSFTALNDINISIDEGEFVCLLGPSGCGKTTLLRILAGLERPTEGKVYIRGVDVTNMAPAKRNYGIVFQSYALFPNMTVGDNIAFGLRNKKVPKIEIREKVKKALEQVNLSNQIDKYPAQLSGGQQQRVALARALVLSPDFLLLDEPLSALDAKVRQKVRKEIRTLQQNLGITTIMVTHDQEEALTMADKLIVMNNACVRQEGTPIEVYQTPNSPFVADFIGSINFFQTDISESEDTKLSSKSPSWKMEDIGENEKQKVALRKNRYRVKACRPENIEIVDKGTSDSFKVTVEDIEFHGFAFRLSLALRSSTAAMLGSDEIVYFDMPTEEFEESGLKVGDKIYIHFKDGKLLYYNLDVDQEVYSR
ncbi:MAG: putative 2-aminoethylphosphonate ABC transporter ATP-binding protein [Lachnospiraceae bacterium]|nr:putative 2-aminoethylphosphonate ABC transporter ATP-binding protein [Lachnospiraceae bacterium]